MCPARGEPVGACADDSFCVCAWYAICSPQKRDYVNTTGSIVSVGLAESLVFCNTTLNGLTAQM